MLSKKLIWCTNSYVTLCSHKNNQYIGRENEQHWAGRFTSVHSNSNASILEPPSCSGATQNSSTTYGIEASASNERTMPGGVQLVSYAVECSENGPTPAKTVPKQWRYIEGMDEAEPATMGYRRGGASHNGV